MTDRTIEVLPAGSTPTTGNIALFWPTDSERRTNVISTLPWDLPDFAAAIPTARDFFRITAAAYLADTALPKPQVSLHRNIDLMIHVEEPDAWGTALSQIADLLNWLTGDAWNLSLRGHDATLPLAVAIPVGRVQLLSGGLDSLCGAVIGLRDGVDLKFVGHRDASRAVRHAQSVIADAIGEQTAYDRYEFYVRETAARKNQGPRSRSLMFMALGTLAAVAQSATEMWVPENGFTSINPPLDAGRGGALTTRSTHPYTFQLVADLLATLDIDVTVRNPFSVLTKGELVTAAVPELLSDRFKPAVEASLSCAKGGSQFHGGNSNHNCGLCVACVVRRGAFLGARVPDPTPYDCEQLTGSNLSGLVNQRRRDILSLRDAAEDGIPEDLVLSSTLWPVGTSFDGVLDLVRRGLKEVSLVPLPSH